MRVETLEISDILMITPRRFADDRGVFAETYNRRDLRAAGIDCEFVQDNQSISTRPGTVRGLHFQAPPAAQAKLVRVARGAVLDVVVDLRRGSPSYGRHVACELRADSWNQLYIPVGFAHGFCTLEANTEVIYKVSAHYAPKCDLGVRWDDPDLTIDWPVSAAEAVLSDKDRSQPWLADLGAYFTYQPRVNE